jgi:drug/metabolite transporter (DMT)-like permease
MGVQEHRVKKEKFVVVVSYALIFIVWGSTYFFIKAAVHTIHPSVVVGLRFLIGSVLLLGLARMRGGLRNLPAAREMAGAAILGIFLLLMGNGLVTVAEKKIPSWMASVVVTCMPIYVAFFNFILYRIKVSAIRLVGAIVGIAGVLMILFPESGSDVVFDPSVLLAVIGALAWGLGSSMSKTMPKPKDVLVSTAIQMFIGGIASIAIGIATGVDVAGSILGASAWSLFSLGYLALMGGLTLVAYNHLLVVQPSFRVSSYTLVNPLIAVGLGVASGEKTTRFFLFGSPLVLTGLVLILYGDAIRAVLGRTKPAGVEPG